MTYDEVKALFTDNPEFSKGQNIKNRLAHRDDVHAFMMLDRMFPPTEGQEKYGPPDLVSGAEHDKIHLSVSIQHLVDVGVWEIAIIDLVRCGVMVGDDDYLTMFV
jgi:hypothetical protein